MSCVDRGAKLQIILRQESMKEMEKKTITHMRTKETMITSKSVGYHVALSSHNGLEIK